MPDNPLMSGQQYGFTFDEIMQSLVSDRSSVDAFYNMNPWDDDYLYDALAHYINRSGGTQYDITADAFFNEEPTTIYDRLGYDFWNSEGTYSYPDHYIEGSKSIDFNLWKDEYGYYFPTFDKNDYNRLVDQHLLDKEIMLSDLTEGARNTNFDTRSVVGTAKYADILENTINVSSKLKDLSHLSNVEKLTDAYNNDLYSMVADLASTGAFNFLESGVLNEWESWHTAGEYSEAPWLFEDTEGTIPGDDEFGLGSDSWDCINSGGTWIEPDGPCTYG